MRITKKRLLIYLLALVGIFWLWSSVIVPQTALRTSVCGACHQTRREYKSWAKSNHKNIGCLKCHSQPGIGGLIITQLNALSNLAGYFKGREVNEISGVSNDACLSCHNDILYDTTKARGIRISHRDIIAAGYRCSECHGETGHLLSIPSDRMAPSMDKCFNCHSAKKIKKCSFCHTRKISGAPLKTATGGIIAHDKKWSKLHGAVKQNICVACHKKQWCQKCHSIDLPHADDWPGEHGKTALTQSNACKTCHKQIFCDSCHQIQMPHPKPFTHFKVSPNEPVCLICHTTASCKICHKLHIIHRKIKLPKGASGK